jgi:uncharacterized protein (TIGR03086 family)
MDPVEMYERAALDAARVARQVRPEQRSATTPCSKWDVGALLEHMSGGSTYLLGALETDVADFASWPDDRTVIACVEALRAPGALERRCMSPANFEWSMAEATAGTAMDQLVHTWDLAVALNGPRELDSEVTTAAVAMFLPQMPEIGRQAGIVGPEVPVAADGTKQDRLLGAMGRDPRT